MTTTIPAPFDHIEEPALETAVADRTIELWVADENPHLRVYPEEPRFLVTTSTHGAAMRYAFSAGTTSLGLALAIFRGQLA